MLPEDDCKLYIQEIYCVLSLFLSYLHQSYIALPMIQAFSFEYLNHSLR